MRTFALELDYKGQRPYVRGADIFHTVAALGLEHTGLGPQAGFRLAFRGIITRRCTLAICDPGEAGRRPGAFSAECLFALGDAKANGWVIQGDDPVTERSAYPGDALVRQATSLEGTSASAPPVDEVRTMDQAVAMTKALCESLVPPGGRSWILTRLDLDSLNLACRNTMRVNLAHNMKDVFTKSELLLDGNPAGHLYFSLVDLDQA